MPRRPRFCPPNVPVHVIQRGHNRQICFTSDADIAAYAHWLEQGAAKYDVKVHAWVFMTNHVHLLLTPTRSDAISKLMQYIGRLYVRQFNYKYARRGALFEDRFKASLVQTDLYLLACQRYIELNPIRAGMVKDPGDYKWSSYHTHVFSTQASMWTPHPAYLSLDGNALIRREKYRELVEQNLGADLIAKIRHCANTGLILGTEQFRQQFETLTGDKP